jgi:hypothetical protein
MKSIRAPEGPLSSEYDARLLASRRSICCLATDEYKICGSYGGGSEDYCLLGCYAV